MAVAATGSEWAAAQKMSLCVKSPASERARKQANVASVGKLSWLGSSTDIRNTKHCDDDTQAISSEMFHYFPLCYLLFMVEMKWNKMSSS